MERQGKQEEIVKNAGEVRGCGTEV